MMGNNLHESLLAGSSPPVSSSPSPSPSRTAAPVSDEDIGKTGRTPPRLPPPPPATPSLPVGMAENGTSSSCSPSPPSVENASVANNLPSPPQSSPPAASAASDSDVLSIDSGKPPGAILPNHSGSPSRSAESDAGERSRNSATSPRGPALGSNGTALGPQEDLTAPRNTHLVLPGNTLLPSPSSSSPPASRGWFGLRRRHRRLPVYGPAPAPSPPPPRVPPSIGSTNGRRPTGPRALGLLCFLPFAPRSVLLGNSVLLDSTGVEKVIGIFGFSLFGSISLLPSTMDRISANKLPDFQKTFLMMSFGLIWIAASAGVLCGLHGKTDFEQAVCRHTGRLSMLGLVLLVILHVRWALPASVGFDIGCYILVFVALLLHLGSWIASIVVGEDRMQDAAPDVEQQ